MGKATHGIMDPPSKHVPQKNQLHVQYTTLLNLPSSSSLLCTEKVTGVLSIISRESDCFLLSSTPNHTPISFICTFYGTALRFVLHFYFGQTPLRIRPLLNTFSLCFSVQPRLPISCTMKINQTKKNEVFFFFFCWSHFLFPLMWTTTQVGDPRKISLANYNNVSANTRVSFSPID